ncbi:hypothetical protein JCM10450v2_006304 [Rhodotorula kratochvilovae]
MPIPRLPLDVVVHILALLGDNLDEAERREEGGRLARVCKEWLNPARDLAWDTLDLEHGNSSPLLDHLLAHPHLLEHVKVLAVRVHGPPPSQDANDPAAGRAALVAVAPPSLLRLFSGCSKLHQLKMPISSCASPCLQGLHAAPFSSNLRAIQIPFLDLELTEASQFLNHLEGLTRLASLRLDLCLATDQPLSASSEKVTAKLSIHRLAITLPFQQDSLALKPFCVDLLAALDFDRLNDICLCGFSGDIELFKHLHKFPHMQSIRLDATSCITIQENLPILLDQLPSLRALETLMLIAREVSDDLFQPSAMRDRSVAGFGGIFGIMVFEEDDDDRDDDSSGEATPTILVKRAARAEPTEWLCMAASPHQACDLLNELAS